MRYWDLQTNTKIGFCQQSLPKSKCKHIRLMFADYVLFDWTILGKHNICPIIIQLNTCGFSGYILHIRLIAQLVIACRRKTSFDNIQVCLSDQTKPFVIYTIFVLACTVILFLHYSSKICLYKQNLDLGLKPVYKDVLADLGS